MSFGLPSLKVKPEHAANIEVHEGPFGVPDPLVAGFSATKSKLGVSHALEASERNYHLNQEKMNMAMLRNIQGLHAPLRLTMEMKFTNKPEMSDQLRCMCLVNVASRSTAAFLPEQVCSIVDLIVTYHQIGHLPFLQRSNFQNEVLSGRHLEIGFEDILNTPELCEVAGQPHAVVERSLGIL